MAAKPRKKNAWPCQFMRHSLRSNIAAATGVWLFYFYWGFFASPKPWHHPFDLRYAQACARPNILNQKDVCYCVSIKKRLLENKFRKLWSFFDKFLKYLVFCSQGTLEYKIFLESHTNRACGSSTTDPVLYQIIA